MAVDGVASDTWYYIDLSGKEQGPHPLAHMRHCELSLLMLDSNLASSQLCCISVLPDDAFRLAHQCMCAGVEHGLIPAETRVRPSPTAKFEAAGSFTAITTGLTVPLPPSTSADDEAHDRTESSMAKRRLKRTSRKPPSKRAPGASPRKLKRPDNDLTAGSPPSTPKGRPDPRSSTNWSWFLPAGAVCAVAIGVSAYVAWHGRLNLNEQE